MNRVALIVIIIGLYAYLPGCAHYDRTAKDTRSWRARPAEESYAAHQTKVSYYSSSLSGRKTASGDRYNPEALTAAHRTLPFGTRVRITNPKNQKEVIVTINDRGPYISGREFDLSNAAARKLDIVVAGVAPVNYQILN